MTQALWSGLALSLLVPWAFILHGPLVVVRECLASRRFLIEFQAATDVTKLRPWPQRDRREQRILADVLAAAITMFEVQIARAPDDRAIAAEAACRKARRVARRALIRIQKQQAPLTFLTTRAPYYALAGFSVGLLWLAIAPRVLSTSIIEQVTLALCLAALSLTMTSCFVIPAIVIAPFVRLFDQTLTARVDLFITELEHRLQISAGAISSPT